MGIARRRVRWLATSLADLAITLQCANARGTSSRAVPLKFIAGVLDHLGPSYLLKRGPNGKPPGPGCTALWHSVQPGSGASPWARLES